jgi:CarboxypepD_reg-like domain
MNLIRTLVVLPFLLLLCLTTLAQNKITISGYVEDMETGERLIGARVFDPILGQGAATNAYGFFSLTLAADSVHLACTYYDYSNWSRVFKAKSDTAVTIRMEPISTTLEDVEIIAEAPIQEESQMSSIEVPIETIKSLPALLGEVDLIRALQMLPGVARAPRVAPDSMCVEVALTKT